MNFDVQIFDSHKQKAIKEFNDWHSSIQLSSTNNPKIIRTSIEHLLYALVVKHFGITEFSEASYNTLKQRGFFSKPYRSFNASSCLYLLNTNSLLDSELYNIAKQLIDKGNKDIHEVIIQNPDKNDFIVFVDWFFTKACHEADWKRKYIAPHMDTLKRNLVQEIGKELHAKVSSDQNERANQNSNQPALNLKGVHVDSTFWSKFKIKDQTEIINELKYFYLNPASSYGGMIERVVANDFYIPPSEDLQIQQLSPQKNLFKSLDEILIDLESKQSFKCLIKVTGLGGSGKTTFLWHIAKVYHEEYNTFFLESFDKESLTAITKLSENDEPILILLDSVYDASKDSNLRDFFRQLDNIPKVIFVISERSSWLEYLEDKFSLYSHFLYVYEVPFTNSLDRSRIFQKLLSLLPEENYNQIIKSHSFQNTTQSLQDDNKLSLVESKYFFLKKINQDFPAVPFTFEWKDWENYTTQSDRFSSLKHLYLFISAFQHLGQKVPVEIDFNKIFETSGISYFLITDAITEFSSEKSPILSDKIGDKDFIFTRHDMLSEILVNNLTGSQKNTLNRFLRNYFSNITKGDSIYLFRNIHRNIAFKKSPIFEEFLTIENRIKILSDYLASISKDNYSKSELKCLTELIKTYEEKRDAEKMNECIQTLIELEKDLDTNYGKHMLANFYIDFDVKDKFQETENLLAEISETSNKIVYSTYIKLYSKFNIDEVPLEWKRIITEYSEPDSDELRIQMARAQLFLKEGNMDEAIRIYEELIESFPDDYHSRTKLSSVLRKKARLLKRQNSFEAKRILSKCKEHLLIALELNPKNEHTYTELGETFYSLGDIANAIEYLQNGIRNCNDGAGCQTSLGKVYRNLAISAARSDDMIASERYLNLSFETLKDCKANHPNHQPSSIEYAETCIKFFEIYKYREPNETKAGFYKQEVEKILYPLFFDENRKIIEKEKSFFGLRLLLSFYQKNSFETTHNALVDEILKSNEPYPSFWFSLLDIFKESYHLKQLFINLIQTITDYKDIHKIVNKLTNSNYRIINISKSLSEAGTVVNSADTLFKNGSFLLGAYLYSIGNLEDCKKALSLYEKDLSKDVCLRLWTDFLKLISDNRFYVNLSIEYGSRLEDSLFYFNEAKKIKQLSSHTFTNTTSNSDNIGMKIGNLKHQLNWQFGITKLKSLNKSHQQYFGHDCFYIHLVTGELYQRKKIPVITDEHRYKIAKTNYEIAYKLAEQNQFSFLEYSPKKNQNSIAIDNNKKKLEYFYFERLVNNMVDCYLNLHHINNADLFIDRATRIINNHRIKYNRPFYHLLTAKVFTRQKKYKDAYNSCQTGLNLFKDYAIFNPEIFENIDALKGALYFDLAYAAHKNWEENKVFIGNKNLEAIKGFYKTAYTLYPKSSIQKKIKEIEEKLKG